MMNTDPYSLVQGFTSEDSPPKSYFSDAADKSLYAGKAINLGLGAGSQVEAAQRAAEYRARMQAEADRRSRGSFLGQIFGGVASAGLSMIPGVGPIAAAAGGPLISGLTSGAFG